MKIAFLADPLDDFKVWKDSTFAMMAEAKRRHYQIHAFEYQDMAVANGKTMAMVQLIELTGSEDKNWYQSNGKKAFSLTDFDAVIVRKDPPFDMQYLHTTYLLERAEIEGARIVNRPRALRDHNEKLSILGFPQFIAPTLVSSDAVFLREFYATHHDVVFKPLDRMGGSGVFRIDSTGMNLGSVIETLTENGRSAIMAQKFIPDISAGDKRILLINGDVVPFSLARIPQQGELRGNLAAGATGVAQPLSVRDREIAETLAPQLKQAGLFLAGLDIIGDWLTEINVTSPTCFREITHQTGFDVAKMFFDNLNKHLT